MTNNTLRAKCREWLQTDTVDPNEPDEVAWAKKLEDSLVAFVHAQREEARREALEEAAIYVETHYPVHKTRTARGGERSEWVMDNDSDGGKVQQTYAAAIRALIGKEE